MSASYLASLGFSVRQAEAIVRYRDLYEGLRDEAGFRACYIVYLVEEVTTTFGVGGYRQQLGIPYRIRK